MREEKNKSVIKPSAPPEVTGGEAIILAGGLGTRLRDTVPNLPKCMALVADRPFLSFVIDALRMQGIEKFVFALGYKAEIIIEYLETAYPTLNYSSVIESEPLGTGGAIQLAIKKITSSNTLIVNGDTLFKINVKTIFQLHYQNNAECTLVLKKMQNFDRYGVVEINKADQIISFKEKQFYKQGLINGGVYVLNKEKFLARSLPLKFSFEKDYLEKYCDEKKFFGSVQKGYFIDIGVPADYQQALEDLKKPELNLRAIDKSWTIFLDRDGVINEERIGKYVLNWGGFVFSAGVLKAFQILGKKFGRIIIVSNQRGVGKLLMTENDLLNINREMQKEVETTGSKIDKIYYCTEKDSTCFNRKPNPGMAIQAINDFPDINFSKSIMVGNKPGDMRFGRAAGMFTVFITTTNPDQIFPHPDIDLLYPDLVSFTYAL
jgi:D-glycero-alpha-D-manno-heptose 1-phosphate guanylyltransferase